MASTPVTYRAPTGLTTTIELYPYGSDTIANGSGDTGTEATNRKGLYSATVTEAITGWHTAHIKASGVVIAVYDLYLLDDTTTYRCHDRPQATVDTNVVEINGNSAAAIRLALSAGQIVPGTVDTVTNTHTPTTTEFQSDTITEATTDHYVGRRIIFTSGVLTGQGTAISGYSQVGGIGQFTVVAMTEAPSNDDQFIIV